MSLVPFPIDFLAAEIIGIDINAFPIRGESTTLRARKISSQARHLYSESRTKCTYFSSKDSIQNPRKVDFLHLFSKNFCLPGVFLGHLEELLLSWRQFGSVLTSNQARECRRDGNPDQPFCRARERRSTLERVIRWWPFNSPGCESLRGGASLTFRLRFAGVAEGSVPVELSQ